MECEKKELKYLNKINSPNDLKNISAEDIPVVAEEIRQELINIISKNGGHLASNLGVVELTMAIHRVFDSPADHIIFDVGHQSYVHKMLTGRYKQMETLRQSGGLCGFTNREESEHDCFGAGHSSTSLSAALGFAISDKLNGSSAYTIAVVGDGAYTGGMIHEALNNCRKDLNLIIILNENEMSISKNIGRFAQNLSKLRTRPAYFKTKRATGAFLKKIPLIGREMFSSNYFESMGLTYLGPIDGNDYFQVENLLNEAKKLGESVVVHLKTVKGKGYAPAENAPDIYHGMSPETSAKVSEKSFSLTMGHTISELAEKDDRICAITAAMCDGTGLDEFRKKYPKRFFDVGIAEEHALTFAAGLAANGMRPVVAIYSTFLQRGFDNIIHDIALQKLPVIICVDRAGLNAADGATHHGIFDVAFLSEIPNLKIYTPSNNCTLRLCLEKALREGVPCAIRYPNGYEDKEIVSRFYHTDISWEIAARDYSDDDNIDTVIICHGRMVKTAVDVCKLMTGVGTVLLECIKPYKEVCNRILKLLPPTCKTLIFLEEEIKSGGMGMNLQAAIYECHYFKSVETHVVAVDDSFVTDRKEGETIYQSAKIDIGNVINKIKEIREQRKD